MIPVRIIQNTYLNLNNGRFATSKRTERTDSPVAIGARIDRHNADCKTDQEADRLQEEGGRVGGGK